jgi:oligopeptide/dipeptide ABC transporter ATP-binding protein
LSGGQQQRVMVAIALTCEPALLIADEPTTALDVTVEAQILELLRTMQRDHGTALLLITHDMAVVAEMADRVVVMYAGQVVEHGPVADVLRDPRNPYTKALIDSIPTPPAIAGNVPTPAQAPPGCRFHPRCPSVFERCSVDVPRLYQLGENRASRCWLHDTESSDSSVATVEEVHRVG